MGAVMIPKLGRDACGMEPVVLSTARVVGTLFREDADRDSLSYAAATGRAASGIMNKRNLVPATIRNVVPLGKHGGGGSGVVNDGDEGAGQATRSKRADARRNEQTLLDAAAAVFVTSGVEAPVRDIAARAGVGGGTVYRHFPTRADLVVAVYRHQVEACAEAGATCLDTATSPYAALAGWIDLFVDLLVTKHGLAAALRSDSAQ